MADKPEHKTRIGAICVNVWKNTTDKGDYNTIDMQRSYKDKDGNWKNTQSMRTNDLPKAVLALTKTYEYLLTKGKDED